MKLETSLSNKNILKTIHKYDRATILLFIFPIINIGFNTLLTFFERGGPLATLRAVFVYSYIIYFLSSVKLKNTWPNLPLILPIYYLLLVFFSSDIPRSLTVYLKFIAPFILLVIAMNVVTKRKNFDFIIISSIYILLIFMIFALVSNMFNVGRNQYIDEGEDVFSVGLGSTHLYLPALAIVSLPYIFKERSKIEKILAFLLGFISFILLGISLRRTTLIIVIFGITLYYLFQGYYIQILKAFFITVALLALTFPIYKEPLMERIEYRQKVFTEGYTLSSENRWIEIGLVLEEIKKSPNLIRILFGKEFLNSQGNYGGGIFGQRSLHGDYTRLLHGSGLVGLMIYFLFYRLLLIKFNEFCLLYEGRSKKELKSLFLSFFILSILISLVGRFEDISFRSYLFLVMGGILGVLQSKQYNET